MTRRAKRATRLSLSWSVDAGSSRVNERRQEWRFSACADPDQVTGSIVGTVVTTDCKQPVALSTLSVGIDFRDAAAFNAVYDGLTRMWGGPCQDQFAPAMPAQVRYRNAAWKRQGATVIIAKDEAAPTALAITIMVTGLHPETAPAAAQYRRDLQMFESKLLPACN